MSDTPTPKTDRIMENILIAIDADNTGQSSQHREEARREIEQIERELAEALSIIDQIRKDVIADESFGQFIQTLFLDPLDAKERELAETQEWRDMLAEALQPFINGWSDKSCDSIVTEQQFRDAKQTLAAVKGDQP